MSESKARLAADNARLRQEADAAHRLVVRLLRCLTEVTENRPDITLSDDLAGIGENYWRHV